MPLDDLPKPTTMAAIPAESNERTYTENAVLLEVSNLRKSFRRGDGREEVILDGIDLQVGAREFISIIYWALRLW